MTALLIQYVPFLYARRGVSRYPEQLARAARRHGIRAVTFVHEPWVPPTRLPWLVLSPLQRRQLHRLIALSHATVTPVPAWRDLLGDDVRVIYVGSTLGEPLDSIATEPALAGPVVFSPFASGFRWPWAARAARVIAAAPELIVIGGSEREVRAHPHAGPWWNASWQCIGRAPADEVLELLARARLVLAPFDDGITGRRTSAMAPLAAGARVLSSSGHLADPFLLHGPLESAATETDYVAKGAELWSTPDAPGARDDRLQWYRTHLDTAQLDARLLDTLLRDGER